MEKLLLDIIIFLNVYFELFLKCPEMGCQHFCLKELRLVRGLDRGSSVTKRINELLHPCCRQQPVLESWLYVSPKSPPEPPRWNLKPAPNTEGRERRRGRPPTLAGGSFSEQGSLQMRHVLGGYEVSTSPWPPES